ncbi:MAG: hypothetical protein GX483_06295 [Actinomycetaceae bacterium]|nr:hypothetical protein [Actinomycetaceae bacterium]
MKRRSIIAVGLAVVLSLGACAGDEDAATEPETEETTESEEPGTEMPTVKLDGENTVLVFPDSNAPEGLQIEVVEEGEGRIVEETDFVIAHYVGQVWGNEVPFDSSFSRGAPTGFSLQQVIPGWTQGLSGLSAGSKVILSIPADLGYGPSGGMPSAGIGEEDTIAFYVEIIDAYGLEQAADPNASGEVDPATLPVVYEGAIGEPILSISVQEDLTEPSVITTTVIARGTGEELALDGSTAYVQYAMSFWDNSATEITYGISGPFPAEMGMGSLFDVLEGIPVGSRVLIVVPGSDDGQSATAPPFAVVVDILGVH